MADPLYAHSRSPCSQEELIASPLYEHSTATQSAFIIGYVNGLYRKLVEVHPGDIVDGDPIGAFQIPSSSITDSILSRDIDY